jgi:hypothetical protein
MIEKSSPGRQAKYNLCHKYGGIHTRLVLFVTMLKSLFIRAPKKAAESLSEKPGGK